MSNTNVSLKFACFPRLFFLSVYYTNVCEFPVNYNTIEKLV